MKKLSQRPQVSNNTRPPCATHSATPSPFPRRSRPGSTRCRRWRQVSKIGSTRWQPWRRVSKYSVTCSQGWRHVADTGSTCSQDWRLVSKIISTRCRGWRHVATAGSTRCRGWRHVSQMGSTRYPAWRQGRRGGKGRPARRGTVTQRLIRRFLWQIHGCPTGAILPSASTAVGNGRLRPRSKQRNYNPQRKVA